jgi:hypothetical protein
MFRSIATFLTAAFIFYGTASVKAGDADFYLHNGSIMMMVWDDGAGEFFEIYYEEPREGLAVELGTLLVDGSESANGQVYAIAKTFRQGCRPATYEVSGRFDEFGNLYLSGKAPIRAPSGCQVIGYATTNNSFLEFIKMPWSPFDH